MARTNVVVSCRTSSWALMVCIGSIASESLSDPIPISTSPVPAVATTSGSRRRDLENDAMGPVIMGMIAPWHLPTFRHESGNGSPTPSTSTRVGVRFTVRWVLVVMPPSALDEQRASALDVKSPLRHDLVGG